MPKFDYLSFLSKGYCKTTKIHSLFIFQNVTKKFQNLVTIIFFKKWPEDCLFEMFQMILIFFFENAVNFADIVCFDMDPRKYFFHWKFTGWCQKWWAWHRNQSDFGHWGAYNLGWEPSLEQTCLFKQKFHLLSNLTGNF